MPDADRPVHDVVVVGAGFSGLVAARQVRRAGLDVVVLEASDRCGGRTLTVTSSLGSALDLGGQWIGHDHHRLRALADEFGATSFPMHTARMPAIVAGTRRRSAVSPSTVLAAVALVTAEIARRRRPSQRWSRVSVDDLLRRLPGRARRILEVTALISWTADPARMSVRTAAQMITGQGGLSVMLATRGGAQDSLLVEGTGRLVDALAADLGPAVRLRSPVTALDRDDAGVTVHVDGDVVRARRVVVAVPPPVAGRIAQTPPLPEQRRAVETGTEMGAVYKAIAVYPSPFWRTRTSAEMLVLDRPGCAVYDTSAPAGPGHVCILVGGPEARDLDRLTASQRRELLLGRLAEHLGPRIADPVDWHEKSWHTDDVVGGGYSAVPTVDGDVDLPLGVEAAGCVHFAATETAADHPGYIDGAIEAGERVAREVIDALCP